MNSASSPTDIATARLIPVGLTYWVASCLVHHPWRYAYFPRPDDRRIFARLSRCYRASKREVRIAAVDQNLSAPAAMAANKSPRYASPYSETLDERIDHRRDLLRSRRDRVQAQAQNPPDLRMMVIRFGEVLIAISFASRAARFRMAESRLSPSSYSRSLGCSITSGHPLESLPPGCIAMCQMDRKMRRWRASKDRWNASLRDSHERPHSTAGWWRRSR